MVASPNATPRHSMTDGRSTRCMTLAQEVQEWESLPDPVQAPTRCTAIRRVAALRYATARLAAGEQQRVQASLHAAILFRDPASRR